MRKPVRLTLFILVLVFMVSACSNSTVISSTTSGKTVAPTANLTTATSASQTTSSSSKKDDTVLCYIIKFDKENAVLHYDQLEWINSSDTKRIKELDLDAEYDFPNGFYVYNQDEIITTRKVSDNVKVYLVNLADSFDPYITDMDGLFDRQAEYKAPYYLKFENDVIHIIEEQFIP